MKVMPTSDEICGKGSKLPFNPSLRAHQEGVQGDEIPCEHRIVVDEGCNVCVLCGSVVSRCVDTQHTSFQQSY